MSGYFGDPPEDHPTAADEVSRIEEGPVEEAKRLVDGEVRPPWPYGSTAIAGIAAAALVAAGALSAWTVIYEAGAAFHVVSGVLIVATVALYHYGRWVQMHFETGKSPRYTDD